MSDVTCYRPTTLKLASAHCPRAVDFYDERRPMFREVFQVGISAHDCLAAIGEMTIKLKRLPTVDEMVGACEDTVRVLVTSGRTFEGQREAPMPMEDAIEGRKLALVYAMAEGTVWPTVDVWFERGLAFDTKWRPVPYDSPLRRFRLILDTMAIIEDGGEDYTGRLGLVRDYKSAWSTDASELETVQMKAQAVAASIVLRDLDGARREVVNLRSGQIFHEDTWLESGGREQLSEWKEDITTYMDALDRMRVNGRRPARPGAGCLSCPWALHCDDSAMKGQSLEEMAQRLALIEGQRETLIKTLKQACPETPVVIGDSAAGWQKTETPEPTVSAGHQMFAEWQVQNGEMSGFLAALKPGMTSLRNIAKRLHRDNKDEQARRLSEWTKPKLGREFGVYRIKAAPTE